MRTIPGCRPIATARATALATSILLLVVLNAMLVVSIREVDFRFDRNPLVGPPGYVHGFQDADGASRMTVAVSYNPMSYYLLKKMALETFWRAPLTGIGLGSFPLASERAYHERKIHEVYRGSDAHSTLLGRLAETGIVGGLTWKIHER